MGNKEYERKRRISREGSLPHYTLSDLTTKFFKKVNEVRSQERDVLIEAWPTLVGAAIASKSQIVGFEEGVLRVNVSHSTVLSVLSSTEKPRLLGILQKRFPKITIRDISFRIG
jgi:hypothetical protein